MKGEVQRIRPPAQPAARQGGSAALESPQGERIAQLEAMMAESPQAEKPGGLAATVGASPAVAAQAKLFDSIRNSPRQLAQKKAFDAIHDSPAQTAQRNAFASLFGGGQAQEPPAQRQGAEASRAEPAQREATPAKPNHTGLPDSLKSGIESLSGLAMDNVRVHYNSSQPAQLNAHAYAQGSDIHVAPGQERHLPHEAWHVVQQAQGRVRPTTQMKSGTPVNDDAGLEQEADAMGGRAAQMNCPQEARPTASAALIAGVAQFCRTKQQTKNKTEKTGNKKKRKKSEGKKSEGDEIDASDYESVTKKSKTQETADEGGGGDLHITENEGASTASSSASSSDSETVITMRQFGGGTGSTAGDAFLMTLHKSRRKFVIDLGRQDSAQNKKITKALADDHSNGDSEWESGDDTDVPGKKSTSARAKKLIDAVVTHSHADHIGKKSNYGNFRQVYASEPVSQNTKKNTRLLQSGADPSKIVHWKHKGGVSVKCTAISSNFLAEEEDKNKRSLGVIIQVFRGKDIIFSFLSLGDMEFNEASGQVKAAIDGLEFDAVKLPHHGAADNARLMLMNEIKLKTGAYLLISGYTGNETSRLQELLEKYKDSSPNMKMLFSEQTAKVTEYKEASSLKNLAGKSGFGYAKNFVIRITAAGNVIFETE